MKLIHCKKHGCHKMIPENVYLSKWKALGFEIVGDTADVVSSSNIPEAIKPNKDESQKIDYNNITFAELKKLAKEKNIDTYKIKKEDLIKALQGVGE